MHKVLGEENNAASPIVHPSRTNRYTLVNKIAKLDSNLNSKNSTNFCFWIERKKLLDITFNNHSAAHFSAKSRKKKKLEHFSTNKIVPIVY